jgi:hypothetical protein
MTTLDEKASSAREIVRAGDSEHQTFRLEDTELTEASAIGDSDGFPKFGDFIDAQIVDADQNAMAPRWVECPGDLARALVNAEVEAGDVFTVAKAEKTEDGAWSMEVDTDD